MSVMIYVDVAYSLAVNYLFLTTDGTDVRKEVGVEPFNAVNEQNDYEVWRLYSIHIAWLKHLNTRFLGHFAT